MVDHFSTYLYQKRGFFYFSKRVPKELHHCHAKHRIVLALNTKSRAKALGRVLTLARNINSGGNFHLVIGPTKIFPNALARSIEAFGTGEKV